MPPHDGPRRRTVRIPPSLSAAALPPGVTPLNKKLLIIDADESVAAIYRAQIEAAGYEVEVALDGETGFHDLYTLNPDAILLDLLLPGGLSGSEILKKTRAQKKFEKIPILVFTNIYTRDVEEEAKAAGALRLFNKAAATPRDVIDCARRDFPARRIGARNQRATAPDAAAATASDRRSSTCRRCRWPVAHPPCRRPAPTAPAKRPTAAEVSMTTAISRPKSANRSSRARRNTSSPCVACSRCSCAARVTRRPRPSSCSKSTRASIP